MTLPNAVLYDASGLKFGSSGGALSIPHMIVIFVVVLVVFGPSKLPELARGLGKLMADFRKASTDFKTAFEEEMREIERQARETERKKIAEHAKTSAMDALPEPAPAQTFEAETIQPPQIAPVVESVARSAEEPQPPSSESDVTEPQAGRTHDEQQPA